MMFYRPHETWTSRTDWRTRLPEGEDITGKIGFEAAGSANLDRP